MGQHITRHEDNDYRIGRPGTYFDIPNQRTILCALMGSCYFPGIADNKFLEVERHASFYQRSDAFVDGAAFLNFPVQEQILCLNGQDDVGVTNQSEANTNIWRAQVYTYNNLKEQGALDYEPTAWVIQGVEQQLFGLVQRGADAVLDADNPEVDMDWLCNPVYGYRERIGRGLLNRTLITAKSSKDGCEVFLGKSNLFQGALGNFGNLESEKNAGEDYQLANFYVLDTALIGGPKDTRLQIRFFVRLDRPIRFGTNPLALPNATGVSSVAGAGDRVFVGWTFYMYGYRACVDVQSYCVASPSGETVTYRKNGQTMEPEKGE